MKLKFTEDIYREVYKTTAGQTRDSGLEEKLKLLGERNALDRVLEIKKSNVNRKESQIINIIESLENKKRMNFSFEREYEEYHRFSPEKDYKYTGKIIVINDDIKTNTIKLHKEKHKYIRTSQHISVDLSKPEKENNKLKYTLVINIKVPKGIQEGIFKEYVYIGIDGFKGQMFNFILECKGDFDERYKQYKFSSIAQLYNLYLNDKKIYQKKYNGTLKILQYFNTKEFVHYLRKIGCKNEAEIYEQMNKNEFTLEDIRLFFVILGYERIEEAIEKQTKKPNIIKEKYDVGISKTIKIKDLNRTDKIIVKNNENIEIKYGSDVVDKIHNKVPFINQIRKINIIDNYMDNLQQSIIVKDKDVMKKAFRLLKKENKTKKAKIKIVTKDKKIYEYTIYTLD